MAVGAAHRHRGPLDRDNIIRSAELRLCSRRRTLLSKSPSIRAAGPPRDHRKEYRNHAPSFLAPDWQPKSLRLERAERRSEEHTSELQSLMRISYAVFSLKKNTRTDKHKPKVLMI